MTTTSVPTELLREVQRALDGAVTWLTNLESGSHAADLPAVMIGDYMPNNVAGRPKMHELAERARVLAEVAEAYSGETRPVLNDIEQAALALAYTAIHSEWRRNSQDKPSHLLESWSDLRVAQSDATDNGSFLLDFKSFGSSTVRRVRVTAVEE